MAQSLLEGMRAAVAVEDIERNATIIIKGYSENIDRNIDGPY
jgi:hypothetical protein